MVWCTHCQEDCCTIYDHDKGFVCCTGCGRVLDQDVFSDEPTFVKDGSGQSRFAGARMRSSEYSSRERTLQKGRDEIYNILSHLQIGGGESTINAAHRLYTIAIDKNFTRGRRTSHVAAACLYIYCRSNKKPYLLIDFSDYLMTSVYVLGAVFLQLCNTLRLADHAIVQQIIDPSLFIHRFTDRLLGCSNEAVARTALQLVASMKRDWMQTGRKPSGLCGAAIYISALSHGLNYSKSDIVTVVHICEATLTKRLIEFENTESGGLTIEEFLTRAEYLNQESVPSQLPRPGEVICKHKDEWPHFAHGLCKFCFEELNEISGGLDGGAEPPAFQRAERQRLEKQKAKENMIESSVASDTLSIHTSVKETGVSKINSDSAKYESLLSKEYKRYQAVDTSECNELQELVDSAGDDPENLSDIDDVEVDGYLHNEEEKRLKTIIWEEMNKEYLEEQAAKEAACEVNSNGEAVVKPKKKRKRKPADEANSTPAETPLEATRQMLKKKTFSSRVNYEALESLYTTEQEKVKKQEDKLDTVDAKGSDTGAVDDGDEAGTFDDGDFEEVGYDPEHDPFGNEDENYPYEDIDF